jgi:hypothetical protein
MEEEYQDRIKKYAYSELLDIQMNIDKDKYPDRYAIILNEIDARKRTGDTNMEGQTDFTSPQQFTVYPIRPGSIYLKVSMWGLYVITIICLVNLVALKNKKLDKLIGIHTLSLAGSLLLLTIGISAIYTNRVVVRNDKFNREHQPVRFWLFTCFYFVCALGMLFLCTKL